MGGYLKHQELTCSDTDMVSVCKANNAGGWAFGGNVPMGSGGGVGGGVGGGGAAAGSLQNSSRQLGGNLSFAQSLGASQPATSLDLS